MGEKEAATSNEELQLAQQIKENYCKESVRKELVETEPQKAAEIFHQIALIHKRQSPDKISLIRCVGLLNAAIFRNPANVFQIKADLAEVCKHVLEKANANICSTDLITKSNSVRDEIRKLRNSVEKFFKNTDAQIKSSDVETEDLRDLQIQKANLIQCVNTAIANKYKEIMADLSNFCQNIMGKPPCKYSIVGMGSLARKEITPYSDFEHIILVCNEKNYEKHLEYFRWFSVIFHVIILNLQESIIPSLNIQSLNWLFDAHTPRGVSFDGMMPHACKFPLGRFEKTEMKPFVTELIKPVNEMLKYLSSEENLKNGYHLADILTKTCFVYGNEDIFNQFVFGVENYLGSKSKQERTNEIKQQVREDLNKFCTRFRLANLKSQDTINIKQLVYRSSTLFVAALASIHNISESSCFDIIQKMAESNIISQKTKEKLSYAVAVACEMRLRVYMEKKSQCDNPIELDENGENIKQFVDIVGVKHTINYFQIAYCLQCEVAKQLNFTKLHFYSDPKLINVTIALAFGMSLLQPISISLNANWTLKNFSFDACIEKLETENCSNYEIITNNFHFNKKSIAILAHHLFQANIFDEALELYERLLAVLIKDPNTKNTNRKIALIYYHVGFCMNELHSYHGSVKNFQKAIEIFQLVSLDEEKDTQLAYAFNDLGEDAMINLKRSLQIFQTVSVNFMKNSYVAVSLGNIGSCFVKMQQYDNALIHLKQSLEIKKNISLNLRKDESVASTLINIGSCLMKMQQYDDALIHLKQSLKILKNISHNLKKNKKVAFILTNIGNCLTKMQQHDNALIHLKQSLQILRNISLNPKKDGNVAPTLLNIGSCLIEMQQYDDALIYLKPSLEIFQNISLNPKNDGNVASTLISIGICLMNMQQYDDALIHLKPSLEIFQNISLNPRKDDNVASTLTNIGCCLIEMQQYDNALIHLKPSLEIKKNISLNLSKDGNIASTLTNIGICLIEMQQYEDAMIQLKQSLKIDKNISLNPSKDSNIASTLINIGSCLMKMQQYDDAIIHLKQSLEISKNISHNLKKDGNVAKTLNNIGICLTKMQQYDDALICLKQSLEIWKNISLTLKKDGNIAVTLTNISICLIEMQQYDNALIQLKQSLEIDKYISLNLRKDSNVASTLMNIGLCLMKKQQYEDALIHLKPSLEIFQNISLNLKKDGNIAFTLKNIGICFMKMQQYDNALIPLKQSFEIFQNISPNFRKEGNMAKTFSSIGNCLIETQNLTSL